MRLRHYRTQIAVYQFGVDPDDPADRFAKAETRTPENIAAYWQLAKEAIARQSGHEDWTQILERRLTQLELLKQGHRPPVTAGAA